MGKYWYDARTAKERVNKLKENYEDVVRQAISVANTMENYVCVDGKWYDDNARVVALWWNQSTNGKSGKLQWNGEKLEIVNASNGGYDGEDRIKRVVNGAATTMVSGIFYSLNFLTDSHHEVNKTFKQELSVLNFECNQRCKDFNDNYCGKEAALERKQLEKIGYKPWQKTPLNTKSSDGKTSDTKQMNQFINEINNKLNKLEESWNTFATCVINTANNGNQNKWWGFDRMTRTGCVNLINTINEKVESWLKSFRNNLYIALSNTLDSKNLKLKKLQG